MPFAIPEAYRTSDKKEAAPPPPPPPPSALEGLGAIVRTTMDQSPSFQSGRLNEGYGDLGQTLDAMEDQERGRRRSALASLPAIPVYNQDNKDQVWQRVEQRRRAGLPMPAGIPATREEFERGILSRGGKFDQDMRIVGQMPWYARVSGSIIGSLPDPANWVGGGVGRGTGLVRGVLIEGGINMGVEAALTPANVKASKRLGIEMTNSDILTNIGVAGLLGGGLHATGRGIGAGWNAGRGQVERIVANNFERLPAPVQARWKAASTIDLGPDDELLADTIEALVPPENRSPDLQAGIAVAQREAQIDRASPFAQHGGGDLVHRETLGSTINRILSDTPDPAPVAARPLRSFSGAGDAPAAPRGSTAISTRTVAQPGSIDQYLLATRGAESGGNDLAKAATSSAFGRYQFLKSTWLTYYKRRYGSGGLSDAQILAKRADGNIQTRLMLDLTADNEGMMRSWGVPITNGNRYLMHFAGPGNARRIFVAPLDAPIESVMHPAAIKANRFLRGKTVGWVLAWSDRKMGGRGHAVRGDGAVLDLTAETAKIDGLRSEVDRLNADSARIRAQMDQQASGFDGAELDAAPARVQPFELDDVADAAASRMPSEPLARLPQPPSPEAMTIAPRLREDAASGKRGLVKVEALAQELGVSTETLREALTHMVDEGRLTTRRKDGEFMYRPTPPPPRERKATSLLQWIADKGGIEDRGGDVRSMGGDRWHLHDKPVKIKVKGKGGKIRERLQERVPGRSPLIRDISGLGQASMIGGIDRFRPNAPDNLFAAAISDGYFPELRAATDMNFNGDIAIEKPDLALFYQAISDELAGNPRWSVDTRRGYDALTQADRYWQQEDPFALSGDEPFAPEEILPPSGLNELGLILSFDGLTVDDIDPDILRLTDDLHATDPSEPSWSRAFEMAQLKFADGVRWEAFDQTGDMDYVEYDYDIDPFDPANWPDEPGRSGGAAAQDRRGSTGGPADAGQSGARGGAAGSQRAATTASPPLAELPEAALTEFLDPEGPAAKAQLESLVHDAKAEAGIVAREDVGNGSWVRITNTEQGVEIDYNVQGWAGGSAGTGLTEADAITMALRRLQSNPADSVQTPRILKDTAKLRNFLEARQAEVGVTETVTPQARYDAINAEFNRWETGTFQPAREAFHRGEFGDVEFANLQAERKAMLKAIDDAEAAVKAAPKLDSGAAIDPAIAERQRQQAQLGAEAPMRARAEQDGMMGSPLFDAVDQPQFRLDAEGDPVALRDLMDGFDREAAELKNARDCL